MILYELFYGWQSAAAVNRSSGFHLHHVDFQPLNPQICVTQEGGEPLAK